MNTSTNENGRSTSANGAGCSASSAPVRVGDRFQSKSGKIWKCIEAKPFGVREFQSEGGYQFWSTTTVQMRLSAEAGTGMTRLPPLSANEPVACYLNATPATDKPLCECDAYCVQSSSPCGSLK